MTTIAQLTSILRENVPYLNMVSDLRNGDVILTLHPEDSSSLVVGVFANGSIITSESTNGYKPLAKLEESKEKLFILGRQEHWKRYARNPQSFADTALIALKKAFKDSTTVTFEQVFFAEDINPQDCIVELASGYVTIGNPSRKYVDIEPEEGQPDKNATSLVTRIRVIRNDI